METLEYYEAIFDRPRVEWTKALWREVAEQLAEAIDATQPKKPGRPSLSPMQKDNIPALAFWADQEKGKARQEGREITEKEAIRRVMKESASREGMDGWRGKSRVDQKLESSVKQVRTFRQELKKRNSI